MACPPNPRESSRTSQPSDGGRGTARERGPDATRPRQTALRPLGHSSVRSCRQGREGKRAAPDDGGASLGTPTRNVAFGDLVTKTDGIGQLCAPRSAKREMAGRQQWVRHHAEVMHVKTVALERRDVLQRREVNGRHHEPPRDDVPQPGSLRETLSRFPKPGEDAPYGLLPDRKRSEHGTARYTRA